MKYMDIYIYIYGQIQSCEVPPERKHAIKISLKVKLVRVYGCSDSFLIFSFPVCVLQMSWRPTYRSSKFRNVYGKVANRENCFEGIPITKNVHDNHFCAVNSKFLAIVTESAGGGAFIVIPVTQVTPDTSS